MSNILVIANQKGGVGKTTTSINLAASLAATNNTVLLVDLDPQGNATMGCGVDKREIDNSICEVLLGECRIEDAIHQLPELKFDLLPANSDLTAAEVALMGQQEGRERRLKDSLAAVHNRYQYIIIDCPPSLNMLTLNALVAGSGVLIPMQCEYYALEGLTALIQTIEKVRGVNPELKIEGLLRTMYDPRNNLAQDVSAQLKDHFNEQLYRTIIPRNVRLAEAPSHGKPVIQYDRTSSGALAYLALAGEILRKDAQLRAAAPG
ncbi:MAG TPA: ParA family protein [Gammaproteobacteria bacterium]|nr:ParA family protein [Gammaproteobacteria bacterium]